MKKAKFLFIGIIFSLTALSVLGENNFGNGFGFNFGDDEPKITQQEVRNLVQSDLIQPLTACYVEANPEAMMMKCAPYMDFQFVGWGGMLIDGKTKFYSNQDINGSVTLDDCGQRSHVCSIRINFSKEDKILVQESFFKGWESAKDFTKTFCEKISKSID